MSRRDGLLREMGLGPIWRLRPVAGEPLELPMAEAARQQDLPEPPVVESAPIVRPAGARDGAIAGMGWDELQQAVRDCRACGLCQARKQAVVGPVPVLALGVGASLPPSAKTEGFKYSNHWDSLSAFRAISRKREPGSGLTVEQSWL